MTDWAIAFAVDTRNGKYGDCHTAVFAGLHGIDYDTSFQAVKMAGAAGISGFTAGLVGALKDKNYIDFRLENGVVIDLGKSIPRPYLRIMEIVSGLHEGYVAATGRKPKFHALGVGTPILLPLIALMGDNNTYTSTDSTAPIKDAYASATICLYVTEPAPLKLKAHRIAEYWLSEGIEWRCPCPYCRKIDGKYPPNLAKAREWWRSEGSRRLSPSDMRDESPLSEYLPLLSSPADDNIRKEVGMARIGHNHWVLQKIEAGIRKHAQDTGLLRDYVAKVVDSYMNASSGESWKQATYAAWQLADRTAQRIEKAEPSGPLPSNK
ncbi:MAG: hypothetical protein ABIF87_10735 [Pseudomonadota bacterium]